MIHSRFSRKKIIFLGVAATLLVVAIGVRWQHAARQQAVVATLRDAGATVYYDFDLRGRSNWIGASKRFLRGAFGDDFVGDVEEVFFWGGGDRAAEPRLDELSSLPGLRMCCFWEIRVSDALIARTFTHAPGLTSIVISRARSDDGLVHAFSAFPELEGLGLNAVVFPGRARPRFSDIVKLKFVGITFADVPGETIEDLARCTSLTALDLRSTDVTDEAIRRIHALCNLECLGLDYTKIGDACATSLSTFQRLRHLGLGGTSFSDSGLVHLESLARLETLNVARSKVTDYGIRRFKRALPHCNILATEAETEVEGNTNRDR